MTSLMWAAMNGNTETVRILLEYGADVNHKDDGGKLHNIIIPYIVSLIYFI